MEGKESKLPIAMLVYGVSGVGKTRFAGTAGSRTLYLDLAGGIRTLYSREFQELYNSNPIIISIRENVDNYGLVSSAEAFTQTKEVLGSWLSDPEKLSTYDTIVIDDGTALSKFAGNVALEMTAAQRGSVTLATAKKGKTFPVKDVSDYGIEQGALEHFFSTYITKAQQMGKHFIMLAHERTIFTKRKKASGKIDLSQDPELKSIIPLFVGKDAFAPNVVPAYFDYVWRFSLATGASKPVTYMKTIGDSIIIAKTRDSGVFNEVEKNLTFPQVLERSKANLINKENV